MKSLYRDRLLTMYNYALSKAFCHSRKGFAELIGIAPNNLSNAFSDSLHERYCTKSLLLKANEALNNIFSTQWILTGEGEMYANNNNNNNNNEPAQTPAPTRAHKVITPTYDDDDLEYLRKRVEELEYLVDLQKKRIEQLESEAKKGYASVSVS